LFNKNSDEQVQRLSSDLQIERDSHEASKSQFASELASRTQSFETLKEEITALQSKVEEITGNIFFGIH
jgi:predicted  nucleic acid-binding Zn-ribbon protein